MLLIQLPLNNAAYDEHKRKWSMEFSMNLHQGQGGMLRPAWRYLAKAFVLCALGFVKNSPVRRRMQPSQRVEPLPGQLTSATIQ
jgi:hypothetical protein